MMRLLRTKRWVRLWTTQYVPDQLWNLRYTRETDCELCRLLDDLPPVYGIYSNGVPMDWKPNSSLSLR